MVNFSASAPAGGCPGDHWRALLAAGVVIGAWALLLTTLLRLPASAFGWGLLAVPVMTFLYTGLFITAHDAMHGTVAPGRARLNAAVGWLCVLLYALFSFSRLKREHGRHHAHPVSAEDPDYHDGRRAGFWPWYFRFMWHYVSWPQLLGMALAYNGLHHLLGVPQAHLLAFWVAPSLLSTFQLFGFGTYLVHRAPAGGHTNAHGARSSGYPAWLSLLTCYHFGRHLEHHVHPAVPWWRLHRVPSAEETP